MDQSSCISQTRQQAKGVRQAGSREKSEKLNEQQNLFLALQLRALFQNYFLSLFSFGNISWHKEILHGTRKLFHDTKKLFHYTKEETYFTNLWKILSWSPDIPDTMMYFELCVLTEENTLREVGIISASTIWLMQTKARIQVDLCRLQVPPLRNKSLWCRIIPCKW